MGFSRQECWNGFSFPPPGDLPNPGMEPLSLRAPALAGRFFTASATWEALGESCILPILQLWRLSILGACPKMGLDMRGPLGCCLPGGLSAQQCSSICDLWLLLLLHNNFYFIRKATCSHRDFRDCSKTSRQIQQTLGMPVAGFSLPPGHCDAHRSCLGLLGIRKPRTMWHLCGHLWHPCHSSGHSPEHSLTLCHFSRSSQALYKDNSFLQKFHFVMKA